MTIKEAVERTKSFTEFMDNMDYDYPDKLVWLPPLVNLAKRYLEIQDSGLFPEKKEVGWICTHCNYWEKFEKEIICWKCKIGEMVYQSGNKVFNSCIDEMALRLTKNMPTQGELETFIMNNGDQRGICGIYIEDFIPFAKVIHKFYEERLKKERT